MKPCKICGINKQLSEYNIQSKNKDGRHSTCKNCRKIIAKNFRDKHGELINKKRREKLNDPVEREKYNEYSRDYYKINKEKFNLYQREYRLNHPEESASYSKKYAKNNPDVRKKISKKYAENNPEKRKAKNKLNRAVKFGKIIKQPCTVCGVSKVHAHHPDYSKPLEVVWLCPKHHKEIHKK